MAHFPEIDGLIPGRRPPFGANFYRNGRYIRLVRLIGFSEAFALLRANSSIAGNDRNAVSIEPVGLNFRLL